MVGGVTRRYSIGARQAPRANHSCPQGFKGQNMYQFQPTATNCELSALRYRAWRHANHEGAGSVRREHPIPPSIPEPTFTSNRRQRRPHSCFTHWPLSWHLRHHQEATVLPRGPQRLSTIRSSTQGRYSIVFTFTNSFSTHSLILFSKY